MISKIFLKSVGNNFLLVSCFASSMLIGMYDGANEKYAATILQPQLKHGEMKHSVVVFKWNERGQKSAVKSKRPIETVFLDPIEKNILYVTLADGSKHKVNIETVKKITI